MDIEIHTKEGSCSYCTRAKMLVNQKMKLDYKEFQYRLEDGHERKRFSDKFNIPEREIKVPQIIIDGNHIGGYDQLYSWYNKHYQK